MRLFKKKYSGPTFIKLPDNFNIDSFTKYGGFIGTDKDGNIIKAIAFTESPWITVPSLTLNNGSIDNDRAIMND